MKSAQTFQPLRIVILVVLSFLAIRRTLYSQDGGLMIQLLNGKDGKPFTQHRLLIFIGSTALDAKVHKESVIVTTNGDGIATLSGIGPDIKWIQVLPDWLTPCQQDVRPEVYALKDLLEKGARTGNSCSALTTDVVTGRLIVFARPMTLGEKMKR